jgi:hypothetical protein
MNTKNGYISNSNSTDNIAVKDVCYLSCESNGCGNGSGNHHHQCNGETTTTVTPIVLRIDNDEVCFNSSA